MSRDVSEYDKEMFPHLWPTSHELLYDCECHQRGDFRHREGGDLWNSTVKT